MEERPAESGQLRRAESGDTEVLAGICRRSFPLSVRWQGHPAAGRYWWQETLATATAETWVWEWSGVVGAFGVLVTDWKGWLQESRRRRGPWGAELLSLLCCPGVVWAKSRMKLAVAWEQRHLQLVCQAPDVSDSATWVELLAVEPALRDRGIGGTLLRFCEQRTLELGRATIGLAVNARSHKAIRLYERIGYVRTGAFGCDWMYQKPLPCAAPSPGVQASHSCGRDG